MQYQHLFQSICYTTAQYNPYPGSYRYLQTANSLLWLDQAPYSDSLQHLDFHEIQSLFQKANHLKRFE